MESSRTVVFDLGEVLVPSVAVLPALAADLGVDVERFAAAYWPERLAYDRGGSTETYWGGVLAGLGRPADPSVMARLRDLDAGKWAALPDAAADLLAALHGTRLCVLSNAPAPLAAAVRAAPWSAAMDVLLFSADVGLVKPEPAVFARADEIYGTAPGEVVFFDDRPDNVAAARAHGWDAHVFAGPAATLDVLARA